jgi:uncharacterized protein (TIGR00369 family)
MSDLPAFTKLLGVNVLHRSPERSEAELTVRDDLCNRRGVLHGGAMMALGDTLGGMTARSGLPEGGGTATIESKTNFFAAVPKGDTAHAVCMPLHRGRTTIVLETRITRGDGKLAAIVTQTQLIFGKNDEKGERAAACAVGLRQKRVAGAELKALPAGYICRRISDGGRHDGPQRLRSQNGYGATGGNGEQNRHHHPVGMDCRRRLHRHHLGADLRRGREHAHRARGHEPARHDRHGAENRAADGHRSAGPTAFDNRAARAVTVQNILSLSTLGSAGVLSISRWDRFRCQETDRPSHSRQAKHNQLIGDAAPARRQ